VPVGEIIKLKWKHRSEKYSMFEMSINPSGVGQKIPQIGVIDQQQRIQIIL